APAPDPRQEDERDQHEVEEGDEQREVLRRQRPEHRGLGQPDPEEERARALPLLEARRQHGRHEEDPRQQDQEDVESVDAELVMDPELADPRLVDRVDLAALRARVVDDMRYRTHKTDEGYAQ